VLGFKRKPVTVGEILTREYLEPYKLTQLQLSRLMGVCRKTVHELCVGKRSITPVTSLMLARVFPPSAEFWLDIQQTYDIWTALNDPKTIEKIKKAKKATRK
jgi:addiction module HigA family antidote